MGCGSAVTIVSRILKVKSINISNGSAAILVLRSPSPYGLLWTLKHINVTFGTFQAIFWKLICTLEAKY